MSAGRWGCLFLVLIFNVFAFVFNAYTFKILNSARQSFVKFGLSSFCNYNLNAESFLLLVLML